jgi:nucleoside phosphorylase
MSAGGRGPIAILAAQVEEVAPLLARLGARHDGQSLAARYWRSDLDRVVVAVSGMGRRRARAAAGELLARSAAARLFVVGVAGALTDDLEIGALVVAEVVAADDGPSLATDAAAASAAIGAGARAASVVTVDRMVATVADRAALRDWARRTRPGPAVVDMESYDAVAEAVERGVPATVLRAVSDRVAEELPSFLERCRREDGDLDRRRAALAMLGHPRAIPTLLEMRRRVRRSGEALGELMARLLTPPAI